MRDCVNMRSDAKNQWLPYDWSLNQASIDSETPRDKLAPTRPVLFQKRLVKSTQIAQGKIDD